MTQHRAKMFDRRTFLGGGLAAIGIASTASAMARPRTFFARHGLPIGLQLYTVAEAARNDLDGTLSKAARIGFRTIEVVHPINFRGEKIGSIYLRENLHSLTERNLSLLGAKLNDLPPELRDKAKDLAARQDRGPVSAPRDKWSAGGRP